MRNINRKNQIICLHGKNTSTITSKITHSKPTSAEHQPKIRKTETILCCLQHLIIGYCCTEGERVLHSKKGDTELIQICRVGDCHHLKAGEAKGRFWALRTKKLREQVLLFRAWAFENWA